MASSGTAGKESDSGEFTRGSLIFALIVWISVVGFLALSFDFTERARILPQFVGVPALVVASLVLLREVKAVVLRKQVTHGERPAGEDAPTEQSRTAEIVALAWLAVLVVCVYVLGMLVGSGLFLLAFLRIYGRERWFLNLSITAVLLALMYFVFADLFGIRLYEGLVPPLLGF